MVLLCKLSHDDMTVGIEVNVEVWRRWSEVECISSVEA